MEWGEEVVGVNKDKKGEGVEAVRTYSSHILWERYQQRHEENKGEHGSMGHVRSGCRQQRCTDAPAGLMLALRRLSAFSNTDSTA